MVMILGLTVLIGLESWNADETNAAGFRGFFFKETPTKFETLTELAQVTEGRFPEMVDLFPPLPHEGRG